MVNAGSSGVHFPAYDLNGNVMGLVNATNGMISAKYEYGPFGEVFCSVEDMAEVNPFGFSTKYTDNETDFVYYGYRYYSPALGRWLSRDPIEEQGGLNLYAFVNNDPVNKWDKLGLYRPKICGVGCNYNYNTSVNNVYGSFQKTRCCGDKIYNIDEKCCRNKVLLSKKERIQTGVFVCRGKAHIMPIVNHVWLETPDGPIDVVGGLMIFYSTGLVGQADLYVGKKKDCSEVLLSPCECNRPVENIREDFIEIVHAVRKMWLNGDLEWTYTVCGAHCAHFVNEVLLSSTDALGCSGFSLGPSNFYKDNTAPIDYNMSF